MHTNNGSGAKTDHSFNGAGLHQSTNLTREKVPYKRLKDEDPSPLPLNPSPYSFDSTVILQQSPIWSRAILWGLMAVTTTAIVWAFVAKIEEAIPATGKLEPTGTVKVVQAPVDGVVKAIYVKDGQRVKKGARLLEFDPTAAKSQFASLQQIRTSLLQENQFYTNQMNSESASAVPKQALAQLKLPASLISLTESRAALVAENQLYRAQVSGVAPGVRLNQQQQERLNSNTAELSSRTAAAELEVAQLKSQLNQTTIRLASTKDTLTMNQEILANIEPLAKQGAISRLQFLQQQQEVMKAQSELKQLTQEIARLKLEINEGSSRVQNTTALARKDLLTLLADNDKRLAEIDSQLTKAIVENNKRLAEIDSQLSQTLLTLQYQEISAPANGTVFDLQFASPGFVANSSQPLLKIVPNEALVAEVFITNKDIGFVKEEMIVDVRIDSFPFSEFGDVKGKLIWIGSDALPPDQIHPFYRFPAKIRLERQSLLVNKRVVPLQSGMSVSANIKVRSRTVMSIFTDLFTKNVESLKFVR